MPAAFNLFFRIGGNNSLHGLFKFGACQHYKMPAAAAFYTEIHAGAQNFPFVRATGVRLFHFYNVTDFKAFRLSFSIPFYSLLFTLLISVT